MTAHGERWVPIVVLMIGSVGTMLAATVVNVALPAVIGAFGLGQDQAQWLATAFLTSSTAFMLLNTWAIARFGMRATFVAAMAVFIMGSLLGAGSQGLETLVLGRVLQGAGAGLIQPMAVLLIYQAFPDSARGTALGVYSLGVIFSPALGPAIGGVLIDLFDWRMVFVATLPLVVLAAPLAYFFLPRRQETGRGPKLDWQGLALVIGALGLTLNGLAEGHREGWDDTASIVRLGGAVTAWVAFVAWESRHPFPVLNLKLFLNPGFALAGLVIMLTGLAVYGSTYLIPLFVQLMQHYSPTSAGQVLLPAGIAMMIGFPLAGRLSDHIDARLLLSAGVAMFGLSMLLLSGVSTSVSFASMAAWIALSRFGIATLMPSAQGSAMKLVDPSMLQFAAPAMTFLTQAGGALGVASLSVLLQERAAFHIDAMAPLITEKNTAAMAAIDALRDGFLAMNLSTHDAEIMSYRQVAVAMWQGAQVLAFRDCFYVIALAFAALFLVIPLIPAKRGPRKIRQDRPAPTPIR